MGGKCRLARLAQQQRVLGAGGVDDQLRTALLAERGRVEYQIVLMHVGGIAVEVRSQELLATTIARPYLLGGLLGDPDAATDSCRPRAPPARYQPNVQRRT